jgi:hypothetical protein
MGQLTVGACCPGRLAVWAVTLAGARALAGG